MGSTQIAQQPPSAGGLPGIRRARTQGSGKDRGAVARGARMPLEFVRSVRGLDPTEAALGLDDARARRPKPRR